MVIFIGRREADVSLISASGEPDNLTTYTFPDVDFGDDVAGRQVVIGAFLFGGSSTTDGLDSATIGGLAPTEDASVAETFTDTGIAERYELTLLRAKPTGTSGNVVLVATGQVNHAVIMVFSLLGGDEGAASDAKTDSAQVAFATSAPTLAASVSLDTPKRAASLAVAVGYGYFAGGGTGEVTGAAWSGANWAEVYDERLPAWIGPPHNARLSSAIRDTHAAGTETVQATFAHDSDDMFLVLLVAASYALRN